MCSPSQTLVAPKLKNIIFPTDFSDCSRAALPYACAIAHLYASTIQVVHVIAPEPATAVLMDALPAALDTVKAAAESSMAAFVAGEALLGIPHGVAIERGRVWEALEALIQQEEVDLVVLGTHGRRGWRKFVLGSVAEQIFRCAPCPVLTVGPQAKAGGLAEGRLARILYATDFSPASLHALLYARSLAEQSASRLTLLHVVQDSVEVMWRFLDEALAKARQRLRDLLSEETVQRLQPQIIVERGPAAETILEIAQEQQVNLIVMGAHRSRVPVAIAHLPWAIASLVVSQARCPVLTVRS